MLLALAVGCRSEAPDPPPPVASNRPPAVPHKPLAPARHAVLVVIDTLRADEMARASTPHLDSLAASGTVVGRAWSSSTWTVPSVVSLWTGMPPRQHGWDLPSARIGQYPPLPAAPTIAQVLSKAGFSTTGLYANPYLAQELGFESGVRQMGARARFRPPGKAHG